MSPKQVLTSKSYDLWVIKIFIPISMFVIMGLLGYISNTMADFKTDGAVRDQKGKHLRSDHEELKTWTMINVDKNRGMISNIRNRVIVIETKL